jgi:putative acetyltransferase
VSADKMREIEAEIIEFKSKYAVQFHDINVAWLEEYFEVEPYDRIVLSDPHEQIIKHGGYIFLARVNNDIVGTSALLRHAEKKYELAKMGVLESFRGKGIGRLLAQAAINKARALHADLLVLATSKKLEAANSLYHSMGFQEADIALIGPLPYKRKSVVMSLHL